LLAGPILVVEDEELVRDTIVTELEDAGYVVIEAATAEAGLEIIETRPVALLFTDIRLPGRMDGWHLAEEARSRFPELPVVYATGYTAAEPRPVVGGVFLRKPYLPSTVIATIERLIGTDGGE
jgi:CheY-like chemotaxis protein